MNTVYAAIAVGGLFLALFLAERRLPLRWSRHAAFHRWVINLSISALALGTALAIVRPAAIASMQAGETWRIGLLQWIELPAALAFVVAVLLFDLTFYLWHFANHRVPLLWRFHLVHHIDPELDVSTAFRFHFGEVALSAVFRVAQIVLIGAPPLTVVIYELVFQANTLFQHSNVRLPIRVERLVNRVLVTPRMHGIHHSMVQRENTSNFSVVFAFWDRLCRTLCLNVPQQDLVIGLPAYMRSSDNRLGALLLLPFRWQGDPWTLPDGTRLMRRDDSEYAEAGVLAA